MIPILLQHDPTKVIGSCVSEGNGLVFTFLPEAKVTATQINIFGFGYILLDSKYDPETKEIYIYKMKVLEMSIDPSRG